MGIEMRRERMEELDSPAGACRCALPSEKSLTSPVVVKVRVTTRTGTSTVGDSGGGGVGGGGLGRGATASGSHGYEIELCCAHQLATTPAAGLPLSSEAWPLELERQSEIGDPPSASQKFHPFDLCWITTLPSSFTKLPSVTTHAPEPSVTMQRMEYRPLMLVWPPATTRQR